ncbi:MAG TPA: rhodanese-like domain-containing protein [Vicinamibacterales bacterium]|nr:rhodanese-like domain-containing protein [Vicinamibacterales bacterium]
MLATLLLFAATAVDPIVSADWLQQHLKDANVRVIYVGADGDYREGHVPGARFMDHMDSVQMGANGHRLASNDVLLRVFTKLGVSDDSHVVLYGDSPMANGWIYSALVAIGHGDQVSMLDGGIATWKAEKRPIETTTPPVATGTLTLKPAPDLFVDAAYVRSHLESPKTKILDVRTQGEWNSGHVPNATLILWQDLFADVKAQKFKSQDEIKALLAKTGLKPDQEAVTYCAVGMRASLMGWAARSVAGVPTKIYIGSWQDWSKDSQNPIVKP